MQRKDKFGRPIYSNEVWRKMLRQGRILTTLGYSESNRKPNLFYRTVDNETIFFADMRGTEIVPIWDDTSPLFYARFGSKPRWNRNRMQKEEWDKLIKAKVYLRRSYDDHESWEENGYCEVCRKDFQANGHYCSQACAERTKRRMVAHEIARLRRCKLCGVLVNDGCFNLVFRKFPKVAKSIKRGYEHHTTYENDETITVCSKCHAKIHRSDAYLALKPKEKRPKLEPEFKLVPCELCDGKVRVRIGSKEDKPLCHRCIKRGGFIRHRRRRERTYKPPPLPPPLGPPRTTNKWGDEYPKNYIPGMSTKLHTSKLRGKWKGDIEFLGG